MTAAEPTCSACGDQYEPDAIGDPGLCWSCRVAETRAGNIDRLKAATLPRQPPRRRRRLKR